MPKASLAILPQQTQGPTSEEVSVKLGPQKDQGTEEQRQQPLHPCSDLKPSSTLTALSPQGGPCWRHKGAVCVGPRPLPPLAAGLPSSADGFQLARQKAMEGRRPVSQ